MYANQSSLVAPSPVSRFGTDTDHPFSLMSEFLSEIMNGTPHWDFTMRSFARDILSIYGFGATVGLRVSGELTERQTRELTCELFESHFGWSKREAMIRVRALGVAASNAASLFAPMIMAGRK